MNAQPEKVGRGASQFILRMPPNLRDKIKVFAAQNRRSMNAELLLIVERAIESMEQMRNAER